MNYIELAKSVKAVNPTLFYALTDHRTHRGKRLDFRNNPFIVRIYQEQSPYIAIMKSTQCGVSEWLLAVVIPGAMSGRNIFYVLPDYGLVGRFVMERFDKTMRMTPSYYNFREVAKFNQASSVTLKQIGPGTISFAGSNTPNAFTEFAADWYIVDEVDRCDQANLEMGWERLSNAEDRFRREIKVSNPTVTGYGIDAEFAETDQHQWYIKHDCGHYIHPDFFKHVVKPVEPGSAVYTYADQDYQKDGTRDCLMICDVCGKPIDRRGSGQWVPTYPGRSKRGYAISKLFSANVRLSDIVARYERGEEDLDAMVRFYNADLGIAFDSPGARISEEALDACKQQHRIGEYPADGITIAGIDVGSLFNVVIGHMTYNSPGIRVIDALEIRGADEVLATLRKYEVKYYVIDAMPETRISRAIIHKVPGGYISYYSKARKDIVSKGNIVSVDRTVALDNVKTAIATKALGLPIDITRIPSYYEQLTASTRIFNQTANGGEGAYDWVHGSKPDHFHHATGYMLMAGKILLLSKR